MTSYRLTPKQQERERALETLLSEMLTAKPGQAIPIRPPLTMDDIRCLWRDPENDVT